MGNEAGYLKASEFYRKATEVGGATSTALDYFNWGVYAYYGKNYTEAARAFEQMEQKYPDQPSATYWRGRVAAAVDNEGKTGAGVPMLTKWLGIPETDAYKRKPADMNV